MTRRLAFVLPFAAGAAIVGVAWFLARSIEGPPLILEPQLLPSRSVDRTDQTLGIPFGPALRPAGPCKICGGAAFVHASFCKPNGCYEVIRCSKCGVLTLRELNLEREAFWGMDGKLRVRGSDGHMRVGDEAISYLRSLGSLGLRLGQRKGGEIVVTEVLPDLPAKQAGVLAGDELVSVDGQKLEGKTIDEVAGLLKGGDSSGGVVLVVRRHDESHEVKVSRLLTK